MVTRQMGGKGRRMGQSEISLGRTTNNGNAHYQCPSKCRKVQQAMNTSPNRMLWEQIVAGNKQKKVQAGVCE